MAFPREDGRGPGELRALLIERQVNCHAEGSALISLGRTRVHCTATVEEKVPPHLRGSGTGWVTAEYAMLPRATGGRSPRETSGVRGRSAEIQRLIGRSLRAVTVLPLLGERTIILDCDVLQADGGTRTAAISGAFVALTDALRGLWREEKIRGLPLRDFLGAVSVGRVGGQVLLDLAYAEDRDAEVDCNVVMTRGGALVEIQASGEEETFSRDDLDRFLDVAARGVALVGAEQERALGLTVEEQGALHEMADRLRLP